MGTLSITLPTIGAPNSTEDVKVRNAIQSIQTEFNGNITNANLAANAVGINNLIAGTGTRLLGSLMSNTNGTILGNGVSAFLNNTTGVTLTHTRPTATAVLLWGMQNVGGTATVVSFQIFLAGVGQGVMNWTPTLAAGDVVTFNAIQTFTVTPGSVAWNAQASQGANATTCKNVGMGLLLIFEQY